MDLPPMKFATKSQVDPVTPEGTFVTHTSFQSFEVEPGGDEEMAKLMNTSFDAIKGLEYETVQDLRGQTRDFRLTGTNQDAAVKVQLDQLRQNMNQMQVWLPEESVGKGASWLVDFVVTANGMPMHAKATYTVRKLKKDRVDLDVVLDMSIEGDGAIAGQAVSSFEGGGKGRITWDLAHVTAAGNLTYQIAMSVSTIGMSMTMDSDITMRPKVD